MNPVGRQYRLPADVDLPDDPRQLTIIPDPAVVSSVAGSVRQASHRQSPDAGDRGGSDC
jgi:hypothetical protein